MAEKDFVQATIPRFDGHYDHWSMLMENFLRSKEYWSIVENEIQAPVEGVILTNAQQTEFEARKLKDLKAKIFLFQAIGRTTLEMILGKDTSKDIWDSMKKKYEGSIRLNRVILQGLRRDFENLQMKDGESISKYFSSVMEICTKMRSNKEKITNMMIVEKILRSMTPKFDFVIFSIEESKDIDSLSLDELESSLLVHEQKLNRSSTVEEQALKASTFINSSNSRGRGRGRSRGQGRGGRGNRDGGRRQSSKSEDEFHGRHYDKSNIESFRLQFRPL